GQRLRRVHQGNAAVRQLLGVRRRGVIEMSSDLPKRPEPKPEEHKAVDPTDRVKSASDRVEPRFESLRAKAEREEQLREKARKKKAEAEKAADSDDEAGDDAASSGDSAERSGGSFSFNLTAGDAEEDK